MDPIKKNWPRVHTLRRIAISALLALPCTACQEQAMPAASLQASSPVATWVKSTSVDRMRGTTTTIHSATSTNVESFRFPYDGGARLIVSVWGYTEPEVTVEIERGQFSCSLVCDLFISFDGSQPPAMIVFRWPDDGRRDFLICRESSKLLKVLSKANRFAIEATFHQEGDRQFFFQPGPLLVQSSLGS